MSRAGLLLLVLVVFVSLVSALPVLTAPVNQFHNVRSLEIPVDSKGNVQAPFMHRNLYIDEKRSNKNLNAQLEFKRDHDAIIESTVLRPRSVKTFFQNLGHKIKAGFQKAGAAIKKGFQKAGTAIKKGFEKVKNFVQTTGKKIAKFALEVGSAVTGLVATVARVIPGIGTAASAALKGASAGLGKASDAIHVSLGKKLDKGMSVLKTIADPIGAAVHAIGKKAAKKILKS